MKKERLMPIGQQVAHIQRYLSNRGVSASKTAIEDYVSKDLHYDENKAAALNALLKQKAKKQHKYTDVETLREQLEAHDDARSERAQLMDYKRCATNAFTIKELAEDPMKANRWFKNPNRFDVIGIDAKASCSTVKHKKRRRKK